MLPFLAKRKEASVAGLIIKNRKPDAETPADLSPEEAPTAGIEAAAHDIIRAMHTRDAKLLAQALREAVDYINASPLPEDDSYDSQNIKAAAKEMP